MSQSVGEFRAKHLAAEVITTSKFEDRHGYWAKDMSECVRIRLEFPSGTVFLTVAEYRSLTKAERDLIHNAPSAKYE